ncbi:MAG: hypothetical protein DCC58_03305 [Chloroflexi bacterium]|nr:MAG: hypothetical protein DCC58_03305 [Chloroflexota bacterium]
MPRNASRIAVGAAAAVFIVVFVAVILVMAPGGSNPRPAATATTASVATPPSGQPDQAALIAQGKDLAAQLGCIACHSTDGSSVVGPTWKGLAGRQVELADGTTVTADSAYIRESIIDPDKQIVAGFQPGIMTGAVQNQLATINSGNNLDALVAYIESLK